MRIPPWRPSAIRYLSSIATLGLLVAWGAAIAAPGDLDPVFVAGIGAGVTPESYPTFDSGTGAVNAVALQSDGKILAGGNISKYNNSGALNVLKRINPDGSLDNSFNPGGTGFADSQGQPEVNSIVVLANDSILVGGSFTSYNGTSRSGILKLNSDGSLDTGFAPGGLSGTVRSLSKITLQNDGKILVGGGFTNINGTYRNNIARLNPDGSLDTTFAANSIGMNSVADLKVAADGKIYVGGNALNSSNTGLRRLYPDGTVDGSFNAVLGGSSGIHAVLLLPSGTILAGGFTFLESAGYNNYLTALTPTGQIDTAFMSNMGSGPNGYSGYELLEAPDGKILVASRFVTFDGQYRPAIARLQPNGTPDLTFAPIPYTTGNGFLTHFYCAAYQPDGKIIAGGWFDRVTDPGLETFNLTRFEGNPVSGPGSIRWSISSVETAEGNSATLTATRFGGLTGAVSVDYATSSGTATVGSDFAAASGTFIWADGEGGAKAVVISTLQDTADEGNENFTPGLSAPTGGVTIAPGQATATTTILDDDSAPVILTQPQSATRMSNLSITLTGAASHALPIGYEWFKNGDIVSLGNSPTLVLNNLKPSNSGSYVLRATITDPQTSLPRSVDSDPAVLTVLEPAGSVDTTWNPGVAFNNKVSKLLHLPDGSTLVGGAFSTYSGSTVGQLAKLSPDGVLDTSFPASGTAANSEVRDIFPVSDGKFLLAGAFTTYNGVNQRGLARINADGTRDPGFVRTTTGNANVVNVLPDGSIVAGFDSLGLRKFTTSGTELGTFQPLGSSTNVHAMTVQPDGKILVTVRGSSGNPNGVLYRLNTDLTIDEDFTIGLPGLGGGAINSIVLDSSGRIYVAGQFSQMNGVNRSSLARLRPDGVLDESYASANINGTIQTLLVQEDGRVIIGGFFLKVGGIDRARLARLLPDGQLDAGFFPGSGGNNAVYTVSRSPLGELSIGGIFTTFSNVNAGRMLRLNGDFGSVQFNQASLTVREQDGEVTLRVKRLIGSRGPVSVQYQRDGGNAVAGTDFTGTTSGTLSWADGDTSDRELVFNITNNGNSDSTRDLVLKLSDPAYPAELGVYSTISLIIVDDESLATVITPPQAVAVPETNPASFSVNVSSATTVTYQWLKNGSQIPDANLATYTIPSTSLTDSGNYSVRVTNGAGNFDSPMAVLTVLISPTAVSAGWAPSGPGASTLNGSVRAILPLPDGGALVGGDFILPQRGIVRLDASGAHVPAFTIALDSTAPGTGVHGFLMDAEGRIYISGRWDSIGGKPIANLARLHADLALDEGFAAVLGSGPDGLVRDVSADSDGGILIGGAFQRVSNLPGTSGFARISEAGYPDRTLVSRSAGEVHRIARAQGSDKIYIGGAFTNYFGRSYLLRLNSDGTRDTLFNPTTVNGVVRDFTLRQDGGMIVGGAFNSGKAYLTALLANGADDPFFLSSATVGGAVNTIAVQPNGKFAIGGAFATFGGNANRFSRVTAEGKLDSTLNLGSGFGGEVLKVAAGSDGRLWVGGNFTQFKGASANRIVCLHGDPVETGILIQPQPQQSVAGNSATFSVTATGTEPPTYQWFKDGIALADVGDVGGATTATLQLSNAQVADEATYAVQVSGGAATVMSQGVSLRIVADYQFDSITNGGEFPTGRRMILSASGAGAQPLSYQWKRGLADIAGGTSAILVLPAPTLADSGIYTLEVTNSFGTTLSSAVEMTFVDPAPAAIRHIPIASSGANGSIIYPIPDGRFFLGYGSNSLRLYNTAGAQTTIPTFNGRVFDIVRQQNGGYLMVGSFTQVGGQSAKYLARLNPDFTLDTAFLASLGTFAGNSVDQVIELPDRRILVAGRFTGLNSDPDTMGIVVLRADGSRDPSFSSRLAYAFNFYGLAFDIVDSTLLLAGDNTTYDGASSSLHRLRLDGTRISSFNAGILGNIYSLTLQPDRKIIAGGKFTTTEGVERSSLVRLHPDGTRDLTFTAGSGLISSNVYSTVGAMALEDDGDIIVAGNFPVLNGIGQNSIIRLRPDGTTDTRFDPGYGFPGGAVESVAVAADGSILATGSFQKYDDTTVNDVVVLHGDRVPLAFAAKPADQETLAGATITLNATGTGSSPVSYQWFKGNTSLTDAGDISGSGTGILTITNAEVDDSGFYRVEITNLAGTLSAEVEVGVFDSPKVREDPLGGTYFIGNSKVLYSRSVGAGILSYTWFKDDSVISNGPGIAGADGPVLTLTGLQKSDTGRYHVTVTNSFGSDTSADARVTVLLQPGAFASGFPAAAGADNQIRTVLPLPNGGAYIGGSFTAAGPTGSDTTISNAALLGPDGVVDTSFNPAPDGVVYAIAKDASGGVFVGGQFTQIGGRSRSNIARFTAAGVYDAVFNANLLNGSNGAIQEILIQPDGKILVAGGYQTLGGIARPGIARLNTDGTVDTSFAPTLSLYASIVDIDLASDGKLILAGSFNVSGRQNIVRLNSDGTLDTGFNCTLDYQGQAVAFQRDGKIVVGGFFTKVNGQNTGSLVRINLDGSLDSSFSSNSGFPSTVESIAIQSNGRILVGGGFNSYLGSSRALLRLLPDGNLDSTFKIGTSWNQGATYDLQIAPSGEIWASGFGASFNGQTVSRLIVLNGDEPSAPPAGPTFNSWVADNLLPPGLDGPLSDADSDGISNLLEYALGHHPMSSDAASLPKGVQVGGLLNFTYQRLRNDINYSVETTTEFITWNTVGVDQGTPAPDGTTTASIPLTATPGFLRLKVELVP